MAVPRTPADQLSTVDGLVQLSFVVQQALERRAAERDLSLVQTRLLGVLRDRRPSMNELASLLELDKSSVTGLVSRAEARGLVERRPSPTDGRALQVVLTAAGRGAVGVVSRAFEADVAALVAALPPSARDTLTSLVSRVLVAHATTRGIDLFATDGPRR